MANGGFVSWWCNAPYYSQRGGIVSAGSAGGSAPSKQTPLSMKRMPAASKVRAMAAVVATIDLPRPASKRTTVLMPTCAFSERSFTVQLREPHQSAPQTIKAPTFTIHSNFMRQAIIALAILSLLLVGALAIYVGLSEFNANFPTTLLCGRVILRSDDAIEIAGKSINKELLEGLAPAEYAKKCAACSEGEGQSVSIPVTVFASSTRS
mgnify:CR=1 FL=1